MPVPLNALLQNVIKTYKLSSRHSEDFDPLFDSVDHAKSPYWIYKGVQNGYDYIQSLVKSDQFVFAFILPSTDCEIWEECKNVEFILEVPEEDIHFFVDEETWELVVRHNADPRNALKKSMMRKLHQLCCRYHLKKMDFRKK